MNYKGEHSITFTAIDQTLERVSPETIYNTWSTFNLIPTSRPIVNLPEFKSEYVEIPQRDGFVDLSTKLGYPNMPRYGYLSETGLSTLVLNWGILTCLAMDLEKEPGSFGNRHFLVSTPWTFNR